MEKKEPGFKENKKSDPENQESGGATSKTSAAPIHFLTEFSYDQLPDVLENIDFSLFFGIENFSAKALSYFLLESGEEAPQSLLDSLKAKIRNS